MHKDVIDELMYKAGLSADGSFNDMDEYDQIAIMKYASLVWEKAYQEGYKDGVNDGWEEARHAWR